jgi:DNA replication protein DnaC
LTEEIIENCPDCGGKREKLEIFSRTIIVCEACNEKKRIDAEEKERARQATQIEEQRVARVKDRLEHCGIGGRFAGATFADYKPTCGNAEKVLQECKLYVEKFRDRSNLLLLGSPGTGKNMLAAIIVQELIKLDFYCLHTTAIKLVRTIKDSWRNKEESEQSIIDLFTTPALLVIDEIGVQFGSPTEQLYITEVINDRYECRMPTILISNLKLSQLTDIMGERVIDRFYDDGSKFLVFDWPSYRRKIKE